MNIILVAVLLLTILGCDRADRRFVSINEYDRNVIDEITAKNGGDTVWLNSGWTDPCSESIIAPCANCTWETILKSYADTVWITYYFEDDLSSRVTVPITLEYMKALRWRYTYFSGVTEKSSIPLKKCNQIKKMPSHYYGN